MLDTPVGGYGKRIAAELEQDPKVDLIVIAQQLTERSVERGRLPNSKRPIT